MIIKNTLGAMTLVVINAFSPSTHSTVPDSSTSWACTTKSATSGLSSEITSVVRNNPLGDQCFLQLTREEGVDANTITLESALSYGEELDGEEHAQMRQYADDYGVEIAYNKLNSDDKVELSSESDFLAFSTIDSRGQYFIASRAWQHHINTSPFYLMSKTVPDMMDELDATYQNNIFFPDQYILTTEERDNVTADVLTQQLHENARRFVDETRSVFEPKDIWVKNGNMWYQASIQDDKLVINNTGELILEPSSDIKYHVIPSGK